MLPYIHLLKWGTLHWATGYNILNITII